ncbi:MULTISPECIES: PFGI-1 class ICE element type IV pilus protein PilL2 [Delftia]|uniref:PFGI-1 class ICE element type IV pilus protein PilL2 n=1 Tax=Delftia TaxID=80865 RepID=UPI00135D987B|nr:MULTISPECIES: hypothetical protein [Delftia]MXN30341.1 hypothetical protein [Delftia sp. CH05]
MSRQSHRYLLAGMAWLAAGVCHASTPLVDGNKRLQLGRYTTAEAQPQLGLNEPLALVAQITFPREQVTTIGEAIDYTLLRTGYALADLTALSPEARRFLGLPLPEAHRTLGPYSVQDMLAVLVGKAWSWQTDHVTRRVWFVLGNAGSAQPPRRLQPIVSPSKSGKDQ